MNLWYADATKGWKLFKQLHIAILTFYLRHYTSGKVSVRDSEIRHFHFVLKFQNFPRLSISQKRIHPTIKVSNYCQLMIFKGITDFRYRIVQNVSNHFQAPSAFSVKTLLSLVCVLTTKKVRFHLISFRLLIDRFSCKTFIRHSDISTCLTSAFLIEFSGLNGR